VVKDIRRQVQPVESECGNYQADYHIEYGGQFQASRRPEHA